MSSLDDPAGVVLLGILMCVARDGPQLFHLVEFLFKFVFVTEFVSEFVFIWNGFHFHSF